MKKVSIQSISEHRSIPKRFISVALDASQIIGGYWWEGSEKTVNGLGDSRVKPIDLKNKKLIQTAKYLEAPFLRIGGTEADKLHYKVKKKVRELPEGYEYFLKKKRLNEVISFASQIGSKIMLTLNAGRGSRKQDKGWKHKNAKHLIKHISKLDKRIDVWELGNEINAYPFIHGFKHIIRPKQYARDMMRLSAMLKRYNTAWTAGPSSAFWPILGEVLPFARSFLKHYSGDLNVLTWHYYPQQSYRSPLAVRRSRYNTMLKKRNLNEFKKHAKKMSTIRDRYSPESLLWLGETGHAQCGGQAGQSDTYLAGFWWLDQLGLAALYGQDQVIRQTLVGGDYGLLDYRNFTPLPDYWNSILWNKLMGKKVYRLKRRGSSKLRLYLHSGKGKNDYAILFINTDTHHDVTLQLDEELPGAHKFYKLTSDSLTARDIYLNEKLLKLSDKGKLPSLKGTPLLGAREIAIPKSSYGFITLKW